MATAEQALLELRAANDAFGVLAASDFTSPDRYYDVLSASLDLCGRIGAAERAAVPPPDILEATKVAREIYGRSPLVRRIQTWPRGYAGDFETIEYILSEKNRATPQSIEYWIEDLMLSAPPAQQHRNKMKAQTREIERVLRREGKNGTTKILSIAAGSCSDILSAEDAIRQRDCQIVICDHDEAALAFSTERLSGIKGKVRAVHGNPMTSTSRLAPHGRYDLVLTGGLFDYLPDRHAQVLIRAIWQRLLAPGGRLFISNVGKPNDYRVWIEYLAGWKLIERTADDMRALVSAGCGAAAVCSIVQEGTDLTWLVSVDQLA